MTVTGPGRRELRIAAARTLSLVGAALTTGLMLTACANTAASKQASITGAIELGQISVRTGGTVNGRVVFRNRTAHTKVLLLTCGTANGFYGAGLRASDGNTQSPAFSLVGCATPQLMIARPGTTVYRFRITAQHAACTQAAHPGIPKSSRHWLPACLKGSSGPDNITPTLPPGTYTVLFFPNGRWKGPPVKSAPLVVAAR